MSDEIDVEGPPSIAIDAAASGKSKKTKKIKKAAPKKNED